MANGYVQATNLIVRIEQAVINADGLARRALREEMCLVTEESQPTRTGPLLAIGLSQLLMLWFIVWLVGYAVSLALGMGGSGQNDGAATLVVCMGLVPFIGAAIYASYDAGHRRPIVRGLLGIVVYILAATAGVMLLVPMREYLWAAVPLIAAGAMLVITLPAADLFWNLLRFVLPAVAGVSIAVGMSLIDTLNDAPFEWWVMAITVGYLVGLGSVWAAERFRLVESFGGLPVPPDEHVDDDRGHGG